MCVQKTVIMNKRFLCFKTVYWKRMRRIGTFSQKPINLHRGHFILRNAYADKENADLVLSCPSHQEKIFLVDWWFSEQFGYVDMLFYIFSSIIFLSPLSSPSDPSSASFFFYLSFFLFCSSSLPRLILRLLYSCSPLTSTTAWATQLCPGSEKMHACPKRDSKSEPKRSMAHGGTD